jgi:hypothetical protein
VRRFFVLLAALAACLFALPATASAAPEALGSGTALFNPQGSSSQQCTVAFAATDGKDGYLIAGPTCTGGTLYSTIGNTIVLVGNVTAAPFPYSGYVIVRVTNTVDWELVPWVSTGAEKIVLTGSKETPVGDKVCLAGPTVGLRCGTVRATDQTFTFPWGTASGLTVTDICVGTTNLGAAFITDDQAQGVPLGGSQFCTTAGTSYFQPINPILDKFGLKLITG